MKRRTSHLAGILAVLTMLVLSSCSVDAKKAAAPAERTQVDRIRMAGGDSGLPTPFAYNRGPGLVHVNFIFDTLLWKDSTGDVIPWLAESWQRSADGLEWRFDLRPGVMWQDGTPLTADDVVFSFEYILKGPGRAAAGIIVQTDIKEAVAESPTTVVIRMDKPYAPFEVFVAGRLPIIPKHIWTGIEDPAKFREPAALIGSGPYRLESYDLATGSYLYTANESYFLGSPFVKRLEYVPADNSLLALRRGIIDIGGPGSEEGTPEEALAGFDESRYGTVEAAGEWNRIIHINMTKGFPYDDVRFRQALAYAIDRQDLVERMLFGRGVPTPMGGLGPDNPYLAEDLPTYSLDVAKAIALLDEIGLKDANGDGVRDLPDGSAFSPELQTSNRVSAKTPELVKEYLRAVGIDLKITSIESGTADTNAAEGRYELITLGYAGLGGDPDLLRTRLSSTVKSKSFQRAFGYNNPAFEELAARQIVTIDEGERLRIVQEMQRIVAHDVPKLPLYTPDRMEIFDKTVFDAWYYTPGALFGAHPGTHNKHAFVTGKQIVP